MSDFSAPIVDKRDYEAPSIFTPESLLREARRQKSLPPQSVPAVCVLDPDGDIVRRLRSSGCSRSHPGWACYHTVLDVAELDGLSVGFVACAVGASFAVLVAEQLFASGCELLISITSSGQLVATQSPPYFVLINRALRDEGTSYHYAPISRYSYLSATLQDYLAGAFSDLQEPVLVGGTWTTDAPYRETAARVDEMRHEGLLAVEMEASALYAFAAAKRRSVICFAHVTNRMGQVDNDFEKGEDEGTHAVLAIIAATASHVRRGQQQSD